MTTPRGDSYDIVVIGAGLGGLTAAAFLARAGRQVLVIERQEEVGGLAQSLRRGPYRFDSGLYATSFGSVEPSLHTLLNELGVGDRVEWIRCPPPLYSGFFGDERVDVPFGVESYSHALKELFPHESAGIDSFIELTTRLTRELEKPRPKGSAEDLRTASETFETILTYRHATLGEVLDAHLSDARLKALIGANWPNLALPPSRLSYVAWSGMPTIRVEDGQYYCAGGFHNLAEALAAAVEMHGGEIMRGTEVTGITLRDGSVAGVTLGDQEVRAEAVVSNGDLLSTYESLVGLEHLPARLVRQLRKLHPSLSAFTVYTATTLDLARTGLGHVTFAYPSWNLDESYAGSVAG